MGYGKGGCTSQSDYEEESYAEYSYKQQREEEIDEEDKRILKELGSLRKEAKIKDAEIRRLKLRVNALIAEISTLKRKSLTDDQIFDVLCSKGMLGSHSQNTDPQFLDIARAIEQAHGIKT